MMRVLRKSKGKLYWVVINTDAGFCDSAGSGSNPTRPITYIPFISPQPLNKTTNSGSLTSFTSSVAPDGPGYPPVIYQWQRNGLFLTSSQNISGTNTPYLTITNTQPGNSGTYSLTAYNANGSVTSSAATLTII